MWKGNSGRTTCGSGRILQDMVTGMMVIGYRLMEETPASEELTKQLQRTLALMEVGKLPVSDAIHVCIV